MYTVHARHALYPYNRIPYRHDSYVSLLVSTPDDYRVEEKQLNAQIN